MCGQADVVDSCLGKLSCRRKAVMEVVTEEADGVTKEAEGLTKEAEEVTEEVEEVSKM